MKLVELPIEERRPILHDHIQNSHPGVAKLLVTTGLVEEPTPQAVAEAADRTAVFRIDAHP
ncbi:hypothetical protein [Nocardia sp. NPDC003979]